MLLIGNNKYFIEEVKSQLSCKFDMKDLGAANFIMGMEIRRDRANKMISLNERKYVEMVPHIFNMQESTPVKVPIPVGVKLSVEQCHGIHEEKEGMS